MSPSSACESETARNCPAVPLSFMKRSEKGGIVRISGTEEIKRHLAELGFLAGTKVIAISTTNGNVIVDIKGSKIAIDSKVASKIMCCPTS